MSINGDPFHASLSNGTSSNLTRRMAVLQDSSIVGLPPTNLLPIGFVFARALSAKASPFMNHFKIYIMYNRKQPRFIKSNYTTKCHETGKLISKGDACLYYPQDKKVYHLNSTAVYEFKNHQMDEQILQPHSFNFLNH